MGVPVASTSLPAFSQDDPNKEILVYFISGIERAPQGQPARVVAPAIQALLSRFNIGAQAVRSAFPDFDERDTLIVTPEGRTIGMPNMAKVFRLRVPDGIARERVINALKDLPEVLFAEPNGTTMPGVDPNDQHFQYQWGLKNVVNGQRQQADIKAPEAWDIYTGNSNNIIAIVDGGIDGTHPDLSGKVSGDAGWGWGGHGIHVAGIASAKTNNTTGVAGVDWYAQLHSQRVDNTDDAGTYQAVVDAVNHSPNVYVLNNSWSLSPRGRYSTTVRMAFAYAYKMNRSAVAIMDNFYLQGNPTVYPATFGQGIIAVGATDQGDVRADFSGTGNHIDVTAPGVPILSAYRNGNFPGDPNYHYNNGSSMAAPHVAGIASLLKGYNPNLFNDDIENIIKLSADDKGDPGFDTWYGTGRVNARRALDYLRAPYTLEHRTVSGSPIYNDPQNTINCLQTPYAYQNCKHNLRYMIFYGLAGLSDGGYDVLPVTVDHNASFPAFNSVPFLWGRGVGTVGFSTDNPNFGLGWCEVVTGTVTSSSAKLRTTVYAVGRRVLVGNQLEHWQMIGWYPAPPSNVSYAYAVLGIPSRSPMAKDNDSDASLASPQVLATFSMEQSYPNPFNPETEISFALPEPSHVTITVTDVLGREIIKRAQGEHTTGYHRTHWAGLDASGKTVSSGIYFYRIVAVGESGEQFTKVMKMLLAK